MYQYFLVMSYVPVPEYVISMLLLLFELVCYQSYECSAVAATACPSACHMPRVHSAMGCHPWSSSSGHHHHIIITSQDTLQIKCKHACMMTEHNIISLFGIATYSTRVRHATIQASSGVPVPVCKKIVHVSYTCTYVYCTRGIRTSLVS